MLQLLLFFWIVIALLKNIEGELPKCKNGVNTTQFCQITEKYPITPLIVKPWLEILKVMDVSEDAKSIKVHFVLMLRWNDVGIAVLTPDNKF